MSATFTEDSRLHLNPDLVGPGVTRMEGIVGEGVNLTAEILDGVRPSAISFHLAKRLLYTRFRDPDGSARMHLFYPLQRIARRWLDEGYLVCTGGTKPAMVATFLEICEQACVRICDAITSSTIGGAANDFRVLLDPYTPTGSSRYVAFNTTKACVRDARRPLPRQRRGAGQRLGGGVRPRGGGPSARAGLREEPGHAVRGALHGRRHPAPLPPRFHPAHRRRRRPDDVLNLVVEVKGFRRGDAQLKAAAMRQRWVPGVNKLGACGRWAFAEFTRRVRDRGGVRQADRHFPRRPRLAGELTWLPKTAEPGLLNGPPSPSRPRPVEAFTHGDSRRNIPTAELQSSPSRRRK